MNRFICTATAFSVPLVALTAVAADPPDPTFGANRYHAAILAASNQPDLDDFAAALLQGERLTVTVDADKGSALRPRLSLVRPDGVEFAPPGTSLKSGGKRIVLSKFVVPTTGRWRVRVSGGDATEGAYTVGFKIAAAPATRTRRPTPVDPVGMTFEGLDGALVDVKVTWKDKAAPVGVDAIVDPHGADVTVLDPVVGRKSYALRRLPLHGGDGTYTLRLQSTSATATFSATVLVTPQGRPSGKKPVELSPTEPWLDPVDSPIRGIAGTAVRLSGLNFSVSDPPTVLFRDKPAVATVIPSGDALSVIPPDGILEGSTVPVTVIQKDGQYVVVDGYFRYAVTPSIQNLTDASDIAVRSGPAAGGATLFLKGAGFEAGQTVRFGTAHATVLGVFGEAVLQVVVPASTGTVNLFVDDEFGRSAKSTFTYVYQ